MDKKKQFNDTWALMKSDDKFNAYAEKHDLEEDQLRFIVVSAMDHNLNKTEKCEIIGLKYNSRPYRKYCSDHDNGEYAALSYLTANILTESQARQDDTKAKLTPIERVERIMNGDYPAQIHLKAVELYEKLTEKQQGQHVLKPWERLWNDVIIPNMV